MRIKIYQLLQKFLKENNNFERLNLFSFLPINGRKDEIIFRIHQFNYGLKMISLLKF